MVDQAVWLNEDNWGLCFVCVRCVLEISNFGGKNFCLTVETYLLIDKCPTTGI